MNFSEALRRFRADFHLTQKQVAESLGIHYQVYQKYELGRDPAISVLCKIADAYNVSVDYLVGRTDKPNIDKKGGD